MAGARMISVVMEAQLHNAPPEHDGSGDGAPDAGTPPLHTGQTQNDFEEDLAERYRRLSLLTLDLAEEAGEAALIALECRRLKPAHGAEPFERRMAAMTRAVWAHKVIERLRKSGGHDPAFSLRQPGEDATAVSALRSCDPLNTAGADEAHGGLVGCPPDFEAHDDLTSALTSTREDSPPGDLPAFTGAPATAPQPDHFEQGSETTPHGRVNAQSLPQPDAEETQDEPKDAIPAPTVATPHPKALATPFAAGAENRTQSPQAPCSQLPSSQDVEARADHPAPPHMHTRCDAAERCTRGPPQDMTGAPCAL